MKVFAYPSSRLAGDYVRAGAGLAAMVTVLTVADTALPVTVMVAALAVLFAVFAVGTMAAHATRFELDEEGLRCRGVRSRSVAWRSLDGLRLAFYATRRDRSDGWMRLTVSARGRRIAVESRLDGFPELVARVARAASANGVSIDPATAANLDALGIVGPGRTIETAADRDERRSQARWQRSGTRRI